MGKFSLAVLAVFITFSVCAQIKATQKNSSQNTGYSIHAQITPYKNCRIYLGTYYGKNKILADSAWVNGAGEATFTGNKKLAQGIYFFVSPDHTLLFEILMDKTQHFSIRADSAHLENIAVEGSPENKLFADYTKYLAAVSPKMNKLQQAYRKSKTHQDSTLNQNELKQMSDSLTAYRNNIIKNYPSSMLTLFFEAVKNPEMPAMPQKADGSLDSSYPFYYVKNHFWDYMAFNDERLLHTPFFDSKLEEYYKYYVSPAPDSVIKEVNYMLLYARDNENMFHYLLAKFTDKYINPEIMGQDKVFLFLFNNFYSKGDTLWLNEKQRKYIFDRAYSLMANQLNEPAPPLDLIDTLGKTVSLYSFQSPFTFIVFWDPLCSHCKEEVPQIDSVYENKWTSQGVKIFAVNVNENNLSEWKKFIADYHLNGWYHAYQPKEQRQEQEKNNQPNFRQLYDVFQTPTMYLLDSEKRIIAKKLTIEQFSQVIDAKIKSTDSSKQ